MYWNEKATVCVDLTRSLSIVTHSFIVTFCPAFIDLSTLFFEELELHNLFQYLALRVKSMRTEMKLQNNCYKYRCATFHCCQNRKCSSFMQQFLYFIHHNLINIDKRCKGRGNFDVFQVDPPRISAILTPIELIFGIWRTCRCF